MFTRQKTIIGVAFLLAQLMCTSVFGALPDNRPSLVSKQAILRIGTTSTPPVIDGNLDDKCWQNASVGSGFFGISGFWASEQTTAYVTYDDTCIYIAFRCNEPAPEKSAAGTKSNDAVDIFSNNSVEIFLDTNRDRRTYYHFAVNSLGARYEAYVDAGKEFRNAGWNPDWEFKTRIGAQDWTAEMRIPFASLETACPQPGARWGINLTRDRPSEGGVEYTSWAMIRDGFNRPMNFGELVFGDYPDLSYSITSLRVSPEDSELKISFRNEGKSSLAVRTQWNIDAYAQTATVRLKPKEEKEIWIKPNSLPPTATDIVGLALTVSNAKTGEIYDFRKGLWKLPPPSPWVEMSLDQYYYVSDDQPVQAGFTRKSKKGDFLKIEISRSPGEKPVISKQIPLVSGKDNYNALFNIAGLDVGRYVVSAHLLGKNKEKLSSVYRLFIKKKIEPAKPLSPAPKVSLRSDGIILLDEKPFCPFFTCEAYQKDTIIQDCFNVKYGTVGLISRPLERPGVGLPATIREDTWDGNNLLTLLPEEEKMLENIRNIVTAQKDASLLLYWFLSYEAEIPMYRGKENRVRLNNAEELRKISRFVKSINPNHLTAIEIDSGKWAEYKDAADVIEVAAWTSSYAKYLIPNLIKDVDSIKDALGQNKPFIFWIGSSVPTPAQRTAEEIRCAAYLVLMHGAAGIVFHMGHGGIPPSFTRHWSVYPGLSREVAELFPILAASHPSGKTGITIHSAGIDYCVREYNSRLYLIAVNTSDALVDAKISITDSSVILKRVNLLLENREIKLAGNGFTDMFTAFEPHVYEFCSE